jgi:hypothetical protein
MSENEIRKLELHNATNNLRNTNDVDPRGHERGLQHGSRFRRRCRAGGGKDSERGGRREEEIVVEMLNTARDIDGIAPFCKSLGLTTFLF